ncbi:MAG: signal peptide peptidase SppA [Elusimicrobiota bacterium]
MDENNNIKSDGSINIQKSPSKWTPLTVFFILFSMLYLISIFISLKFISKNRKIRLDNDVISTVEKKNLKNKVAIIPIYGAIYKKDSSINEKGSDFIVSMIKRYGEDRNIKAIVLDINSGGGSVGAVQEIYSAIKKIKEQTRKPIIAHFGDVAASGAYYISVACDKIISNPGTITGSIGVIFSTMQGEELFKKIGVKSNIIKSGKFKDIGSFSREMTKEEKALLQEMIDDTYNTFVEVVSSGRKIPKEKVKEIADGRVFTGNQAVQNGLVDKLGDLYDAIDEAGIMAGIGKNPAVVRAKAGFFSSIFDMIDSKISFINKVETPLLEYKMVF